MYHDQVWFISGIQDPFILQKSISENSQNPEPWHPKCWWDCGAKGTQSLLVGTQNGAASVEGSVAAAYKTKHALTIPSSSCAPWYLPRGAENLCPHKSLHVDVYTSLTRNCQSLEATTVSFSRWWVSELVRPTMGYYSVHKKGGALESWRNLKWKLLSERSQSEKAAYCMIPTAWHLEKAKLWR